MITHTPSSGEKSPTSELPQWINCHERLPHKEDATHRGYVRVIWKSTRSINGDTNTTWEVGMDHYENASTYLGWMPIAKK
ncbi:hypothetical protein MO867_13175 [Microbulbifer sp. OS29]|uniref:Uncharacterized protein n=1 Tax=Microbulbifer okhotskensis TaxID=2926617 RepID=A0A9X2ETI2_9GAMM|nr:hypothetical protein [Microbulbifer okhotskensis]MCO1335283.1 hypothetical protein [Microbulbifer okhotskensis]